MTLNVPFIHFAKTIERVLGVREAYVAENGGICIITAAASEKSVIVVSKSDLSLASVRHKLHDQGLIVHEGGWSFAIEPIGAAANGDAPYISAVAYRSGEATPGVWVDAYSVMPTQVQVLRTLYDEFRATGELPEVSFEEFIRLAEPNVVIVSPNEIQSFLEKKEDCP